LLKYVIILVTILSTLSTRYLWYSLVLKTFVTLFSVTAALLMDLSDFYYYFW